MNVLPTLTLLMTLRSNRNRARKNDLVFATFPCFFLERRKSLQLVGAPLVFVSP
jgi:hypothetical protein